MSEKSSEGSFGISPEARIIELEIFLERLMKAVLKQGYESRQENVSDVAEDYRKHLRQLGHQPYFGDY